MGAQPSVSADITMDDNGIQGIQDRQERRSTRNRCQPERYGYCNPRSQENFKEMLENRLPTDYLRSFKDPSKPHVTAWSVFGNNILKKSDVDEVVVSHLYDKWMNLLQGGDDEPYDTYCTRGQYRIYLNDARESIDSILREAVITKNTGEPAVNQTSSAASNKKKRNDKGFLNKLNQKRRRVAGRGRRPSVSTTTPKAAAGASAPNGTISSSTHDQIFNIDIPTNLLRDYENGLIGASEVFKRGSNRTDLTDDMIDSWMAEIATKINIVEGAHAEANEAELATSGLPSSRRKNYQNGRNEGDPIMRWPNIKDRSVRNRCWTLIDKCQTLQKQSTFDEKTKHDVYPKTQLFLFANDTMKPKRRMSVQSNGFRKRPVAAFLMPKHCEQKELGRMLLKFGAQMLSPALEQDFLCTRERMEFFEFIYGKEIDDQP